MTKKRSPGKPRKVLSSTTSIARPSRGVGLPRSSGSLRSVDSSRTASEWSICGDCQRVFCDQHSKAVHQATCNVVKQTCLICYEFLEANEVMRTHLVQMHCTQEEFDAMQNDAVEDILRTGNFSYVDLTLPLVWMRIVKRAEEIVVDKIKENLEKKAKAV
ncbi:hypothetical protein L3Y34_013585 [Caenorhabditis briggsae]|nr:hypothetical protein L3Y34_013585 [Caenorhabditis briggsae]